MITDYSTLAHVPAVRRRVRLVAAHAWDAAGALRAGCQAAFVARPGMVLDPIHEPPDVVGRDLAEVADKIIATAMRT